MAAGGEHEPVPFAAQLAERHALDLAHLLFIGAAVRGIGLLAADDGRKRLRGAVLREQLPTRLERPVPVLYG